MSDDPARRTLQHDFGQWLAPERSPIAEAEAQRIDMRLTSAGDKG